MKENYQKSIDLIIRRLLEAKEDSNDRDRVQNLKYARYDINDLILDIEKQMLDKM